MNTPFDLLPAPLIRAAGRLQFKFPFLSRPINFLGQLAARGGVIKRGAGKGLRFDGRGCSPGYIAGTSEPLEQSLILKYLLPGAVFYDVGANAGFYAIIGARSVGPTGQVYAFEPMPELANRVRQNANLNSMTNLEVVEAAVSSQDGSTTFGVQSSLSMLNSIGGAEASETKLTVQTLRLDTFSANHRPPTLILVDIEGDEIRALEGALQTIATHKPILMVEVHYLGQAFIEFFERSLRPLGYGALTYEGQSLPTEAVRYHALIVPARPQ
jgi:FkbM family methyltransferase